MKKIIMAMAAVAAAFTMASCNKEPFVEQEENTALGNCIITASTENNLTKTSLEGDDENGYEVVWSEGDTFKLRGETFTLIKGAGTTSGTFQGNISLQNGFATAFYPASYDGANWPTKQTYTKGNITGSPMKADVYCFKGEITGGKIEFKNVGGILRLSIKGSEKIKSIMVCTDDTPNITLDCGDGVDLNSTDGTVFHIAMPIGTHSGTSILFTTSNNKYCIKKLKSDLVINQSEITPATIKVDNFKRYPSDGALSEPFTVADDGNGNVKKVYFSKGNLYWDGDSYEFEDNQYDYDVSGHHSSFYWSNSADLARGSEWSLDPNGSITFFTNADENTASPDFIANGETGIWRTLSKDEWDYLISRENGIGKATIDGVNGMIIFYDGYSGLTEGLTSVPEGCVFLPASGENVRYWSSTPYLESYIPGAECLHLEFRDGDVWPSMIPAGMAGGYYIRLVTEAYNENPGPSYTVTFDMNGKTGMAPDAIYVPYHGAITKPTDPAVDGYTFWGWYKDAACTAEWNFAKDVVTSNTTLYANWKISGVLAGTFTVDGSGKKVYFSKGNLWRANDGSFHFEDNQYDFNSDDYNTSHISHFMWSKDVDVACSLQYDDPSASADDVFFTNAKQDTPNPDFTANGQTGVWRTLSNDEWEYLLENNGSVLTTVNNIYGLIVFYDGYSGSTTGLTEIPKGCLFLPAAGARDGSDVNFVGDYGLYWSSSAIDEYRAYGVSFDSFYVTSGNYDHRYGGFSVRLITESK